MAGNLPVIFTAPHGGSLTPEDIPARSSATCGPKTVTQTDLNTQDLARQIQQAFFAKTGKYPHVVINRLARSRLDANRDIGAAAAATRRSNKPGTTTTSSSTPPRRTCSPSSAGAGTRTSTVTGTPSSAWSSATS
ncbi:hypothetical protein [Streptomyces sp. NPDC050388]|uniref:hypothetical protein n=1 Tax=Streptomyces sp. NPDC050388 TaxID=3155781 RepID=UPI00342A548A